MKPALNVYCDESCHLEHDHQPIMVLGAVWCPEEKTRESSARIREIKAKHGLPRNFEVKWTKVSPSKVNLYLDIIDYFFDDDDLHFRAVAATKTGLDHPAFAQDHDTWYYKMYFVLLELLLSPDLRYRIYVDIKDTRSQAKAQKLREILCNSKYDFDRRIIERIQQVSSHEVEQIQLADLLIGAVCGANRGKTESGAKRELIERVKRRSGYSLTKTTLIGERKFNLLRWTPQEVA